MVFLYFVTTANANLIAEQNVSGERRCTGGCDDLDRVSYIDFTLNYDVVPINQIFGNLTINESSVGQTFVETSSSNNNFDNFVSTLTDGNDDWGYSDVSLYNASGMERGGVSRYWYESHLFATIGVWPDLKGFDVTEIALTVNDFSLIFPAADQFDPSYDLTYSFYGTPTTVPIPGSIWLLFSGVAGLVSLRRKFKE